MEKIEVKAGRLWKVRKQGSLKRNSTPLFWSKFHFEGGKSTVSIYTFRGTKIWTNFIIQIFEKIKTQSWVKFQSTPKNAFFLSFFCCFKVRHDLKWPHYIVPCKSENLCTFNFLLISNPILKMAFCGKQDRNPVVTCSWRCQPWMTLRSVKFTSQLIIQLLVMFIKIT